MWPTWMYSVTKKRQQNSCEMAVSSTHVSISSDSQKRHSKNAEGVPPTPTPHHLSGSIPSCHTSWNLKKIFLPIVMASEKQEYCYQIWRPKPQLASLPKRTTRKILWVACVSLKDASREKLPLAFDENHLQLLFPTGVITKDSTPEEMAEPTSSAGELFLMNSPAPIFYRHGFHLHSWNCFN